MADKKYALDFEMSDGTTYSVEFIVPQGEKGDKGDDGTGVNVKADATSCKEIGDAYIDSAGNLMILTALPNTFTNGGQIKGPKGDKGDTGADGKDGTNGKDGYTPIKGTDYFTPKDISDMVNEVITALPKYNGEVVDV